MKRLENVKFGRIVAKKDGLEQNISKEEIQKKLEEGWYVGVEFFVDGENGWIVIDGNKVDVLALDKGVITLLKENEEEILKSLGVI